MLVCGPDARDFGPGELHTLTACLPVPPAASARPAAARSLPPSSCWHSARVTAACVLLEVKHGSGRARRVDLGWCSGMPLLLRYIHPFSRLC